MHKITEILAIFHDAVIEGFKGDDTALDLQIACPYIADIEKAGNEYFFLTIRDVKRFEFHHWSGNLVKGIDELVDLDLEIGYSKIEDTIIKTSCLLWSELEGEIGGELWIEASFGELQNQDRETMHLETLNQLSKMYWSTFKKQT